MIISAFILQNALKIVDFSPAKAFINIGPKHTEPLNLKDTYIYNTNWSKVVGYA